MPKGANVHWLRDHRAIMELIESGPVQHNWEKHYSLKEGDIFVEAGAFWGRYVWKASKKVGTGRVIAIEPSPYNIRILKILKEVERLDNVTIVEKAIWSEPGKEQFFVQENPASHQLKRLPLVKTGEMPSEEAEYVEVDADTIENILNDLGLPHVDLLGADIEGAGLAMLKGCGKFLDGRIRNIAVAVYHMHKPKIDEFMSILKDKGYKASREDEGIVYARKPWIGDDGIDWDFEAERASKGSYPYKAGRTTFAYFKDLIRPRDRVLDLGCNIASWIGAWRDIEPTIEYEGLDRSRVAISIARERYPDAKFYIMDAREMDFHERFDVVFTHAVYQHTHLKTKKEILPR
ncbi:MAG: class I SAM-dependent methyltransferase, partial [Thermoplasmata archaeon]|nr:class I SAM-dependent methyltransferase [Thermoplasmata archaeon]